MLHNIGKDREGIGLTEILTSTVIILLAAAGLSGFITYNKSILIRTANFTQATELTAGKADELLTVEPDDPRLAAGVHTNPSGGGDYTDTGADLPDGAALKDRYSGERRYVIEDWLNADGDIADTKDFKKIGVTTAWKDTQAGPVKEVTITTIRKR